MYRPIADFHFQQRFQQIGVPMHHRATFCDFSYGLFFLCVFRQPHFLMLSFIVLAKKKSKKFVKYIFITQN
jgi:hypothetical protein